MTVASNVWDYEASGNNRCGTHGAWFPIEEIASMLHGDQDAFVLLAYLRAQQGPSSTFMCANGLAETFGWRRHRFAEARRRLIEMSYIVQIRKPHQGLPALFQWWG
jgi:hypothetical protein